MRFQSGRHRALTGVRGPFDGARAAGEPSLPLRSYRRGSERFSCRRSDWSEYNPPQNLDQAHESGSCRSNRVDRWSHSRFRSGGGCVYTPGGQLLERPCGDFKAGYRDDLSRGVAVLGGERGDDAADYGFSGFGFVLARGVNGASGPASLWPAVPTQPGPGSVTSIPTRPRSNSLTRTSQVLA